MDSAFHGSLVLLPVLYTTLVIGYARIFSASVSGLARVVRPILLFTVGIHLVSLILRGIEIGACPMGSAWEFLSLIALGIAITYLLVELRIEDRNTGVFVISYAFLLQLGSSVFILSASDQDPIRLGGISSVQALAAIAGYSAVTVSCIYGILYLFLYRAIKRARFGLFYRKIPDLETLGRQNFHSAVFAFAFLTVSLGVDLVSGEPLPPEVTSGIWLERIVVGLTWVLFGTVTASRLFFHLGGKRLAYTTLLGFVLPTIVAFVGWYGRGLLG